MADPAHLIQLGNASVVAPAGHGKTELIAKMAALGRRTLVLTHTHAGVHAIRARLKRMGIANSQAPVDTIASWCTRYAYSFPGVSQPPPGDPQSAQEWDQLHRGVTQAFAIDAIRQVIIASYDRILVDEYQDCNALQHDLVLALSSIVPITIFGDPMQGIFEFAGATLDWDTQIHPHFPKAEDLETPHRWEDKNPDLGRWIAETRLKLQRGEPIDLADPRISYRASSDAFDMGVLFDGMDGKEGSFAAIHCNKGLCYRLANAANGGYQAIEEVAAYRLGSFARDWDASSNARERLEAIKTLSNDCFHKRELPEGVPPAPDEVSTTAAMRALSPQFNGNNPAEAAAQILALMRKLPRWKIYRSGLWKDAESTCHELAAGRVETMSAAAERIKQRASNIGRRLPTRTVSTPLLLKGLEFDHVVIPDATHFIRERQANAKLFYVAISRATRSLTVGSSSPLLQF